MPEWIGSFLELFKDYWPAITQLIVIWYVGQVFKKRVWTKARADKNGFVNFMRATLPFHPVVAGAIWGALFPWLPAVAFVTTRGGAINEGLLMGTVTVLIHVGLEQYAKTYNVTWLTAVLQQAVPEDGLSMAPPPPSAP